MIYMLVCDHCGCLGYLEVGLEEEGSWVLEVVVLGEWEEGWSMERATDAKG